jgi:hypothetical protein
MEESIIMAGKVKVCGLPDSIMKGNIAGRIEDFNPYPLI